MLHSFKFNDKYIALDPETLAVHILDELAYEVLNNKDNLYALPYERDIINEILKELKEIEPYEPALLQAEDGARLLEADPQNQPVKSLCLHVAHDCNLRCKYCFAGTGEFCGERMIMPWEVARASLDFLIEHSMLRQNLEVDFFGGEPLLNMDVIKRTVEYGRELENKHNKKINFTITTNGVALTDEIADYLNENMFNIVISLDGRREIHDSLRPTAGGKPSYDVTLRNAKKLIRTRGDKEYYIRGTFTNRNLDFAEDVRALFNEGFEHISIEPVVLGEDSEYALRKEHLERICEEYDRLSEIVSVNRRKNGKLNFFHFNIDLSNGPCLKRRLKGCGAGVEYAAISPEGDIYPCHQFVGEKSFIMGNVLAPGRFNDAMRLDFMRCNIFTKEGCSSCFARFFCGGGCAANAYKFNGSIYKPHLLSCEMLKKRTECAIGLFAEEHE